MLLLCTGCYPDQDPSYSELGGSPTLGTDSLQVRELFDLQQKRLSIQEAFLQLPESALVLEGLRSLSKIERKLLLQTGYSHRYVCTVTGNYLAIQEKADNLDDEQEQLEHFTLGVYNALTHKTIVFVSQTLKEENRRQQQVIQQQFLEYQTGQWKEAGQQLPTIDTKTFFEAGKVPYYAEQQFIYFELQEMDVNYLQAHLQHDRYSNKDSVALQEAYEVALVWTGDGFRLNRQPMVQYEISEHHSK